MVPPGEGKAGQQLPQLVDGESPEKLAALKAALQQLGDELQPVAAAGEAPNPEGKEVVDIREEWREGDPLHSGLAGGGTQLSPTASVASSADWFEDLMQRMEALGDAEVAAARQQAANGGDAESAAGTQAAAASAAAAVPSGSGQRGSKAGKGGSGFKPGFLLGKRLETTAEARSAADTAAGISEEEAEEQRQHQQAATARREAAFTGRVVERTDPEVEPAAARAPAPAAATALRPAFVERGSATSHASGQRPVAQQDAEDQPPQQRVSRFKLRRQHGA